MSAGFGHLSTNSAEQLVPLGMHTHAMSLQLRVSLMHRCWVLNMVENWRYAVRMRTARKGFWLVTACLHVHSPRALAEPIMSTIIPVSHLVGGDASQTESNLQLRLNPNLPFALLHHTLCNSHLSHV